VTNIAFTKAKISAWEADLQEEEDTPELMKAWGRALIHSSWMDSLSSPLSVLK